MTDERKNEIWAFLTLEEKAKYRIEFLEPTEDDWDSGYKAALHSVFGSRNLAAKAEEKPKEPLCSVTSQNYNNGNHIVGRENTKELANSFQSSTDWNKYRLGLAKEIAVAMVKSTQSCYPNEVVALANEIVERLKETEG